MKNATKRAGLLQTGNRLAQTTISVLIIGLLASPVAAQYDGAPGDASGAKIGAPLEDARRVLLGVSVGYDSNFFRDPEILRGAQSEMITTAYVGLRIDKPYAQQRFLLDATATAYRYNNFSYLNFEGFDYKAAWYWTLTPRLSGTLSADRTQAPTQFQDTFGRQSDVTTTKDYTFNLSGRVFGGWHLLLGITQSDRTSELALAQGQPDYRETRGEAGIRYAFQTGNSIGALWRRIEGDQDSRVVNNTIVLSSENYKEDQGEIRGTWNPSAKSVLTARATYLDRRYDQVPASDFSGTAGSLGYTWLPTSKLSLRLNAVRDIAPWQSLTSNYRVSNMWSFVPAWQATERVNAYMNLQQTYEDYPSASTIVPERNDTTSVAVLGVNWLVLRNLSLGANVQYQRRSSNDPLVEYDATTARISASLIF